MNATMMKKALLLAETMRGFCAPNPSVGAILVKNGKIISQGVHHGPGTLHGEAEAIKTCDRKAEGSTLYVTLEPCCHHGRTPPCTDLIIQSKIKAVYFGYQDPNPIVAGKGIKQLKAAGIECHQMAMPEIDEFYRSYTYWTRHRRPWVVAKIAMSLDGKIAGPHGKPIVLTGKKLQRYTHEWRKKSDAILTTVKTIINDDPKMNVRLEGKAIKKRVYVIDSNLQLPHSATLLKTAKEIILFHSSQIDKKNLEKWDKKNSRCVAIPEEAGGLNLEAILAEIGRDGVHDLWVEAGGRLFTALFNQGLLNRALVCVAPKIVGSEGFPDTPLILNPRKRRVEKVEKMTMGEDVVCDIRFSE